MGNAGSIVPPGGGTLDPGIEVLRPSDRDRILQAMTELCAEQGYAETTIAEVVDRAGVSREGFEALFADKEDCAVAAINKVASDLLTAVATAATGGSDPIAQGIAALRAILAQLAARPATANLGYVEARQGGTARMYEAYESGAQVLAVMMGRAAEAAERAPPATIASRAALGGAEAVVRREIAAGRIERLPELLGDFVYAALVPALGQEEALRVSRLAARRQAEES